MVKREAKIVSWKYYNNKYELESQNCHFFVIEETGDILSLYLTWGDEKYELSKEDMDLISLPMEYVPQYLGMFVQAFSSESNPRPLVIGDEEYVVMYNYNEREGRITGLHVSQFNENKPEAVQVIDLEWNTVEIPWDVTKRVMPESLAWLIANLKDVYNEWQEVHPDKPRIA